MHLILMIRLSEYPARARFFFTGQYFRLFGKELLPYTVSQHIIMIITDIDVNGIVTVCAADLFYPWQIQYLWMLTKIPDVGLIACQSCTVDTALLTGTDTDGLSVLDVADRI